MKKYLATSFFHRMEVGGNEGVFRKIKNMRLTHNPKEILGLRSDILLSCCYRKVKEVLGIKFTKQFRKFCAENQIRFYITELAVTKLDFDKSFLDDLEPILGKEKLEEFKKHPTIKILADAELKASSHLVIFKKNQLSIEEAFEKTKQSIENNIDVFKRLADR